MLVTYTDKPEPIGVPEFRCIKSICLSSDWKHALPQESRYYRSEIFNSDDEVASLYLTTRNRPLDATGARRFKTILGQGARELSEEEVGLLKAVLEDQAMPVHFDLKAARIIEWNNRPVLQTEGFWLDDDSPDHVFTLFADAEFDGQWVEELSYRATPRHFERYFESATNALKSVCWKD